MIDFANMTNKQLTDHYNGLAIGLGNTPTINQWKGKKTDLVARIEALQAIIDGTMIGHVDPTEEQTIEMVELPEDDTDEPIAEQQVEAAEDETVDPCEPEATGNEADDEAPKPRSRTIRVAALVHLSTVSHYEDRMEKPSETNVVPADHPNARSVGLPYDEILRRIFEEFPDCETTVACLRWYAVKVRNSDMEEEIYGQYRLPQRRPRAKPAKR